MPQETLQAQAAQLAASRKGRTMNARRPDANDVLRQLVDTVEATGGVGRDAKGYFYPLADPDGTDLGEVYVLACQALGREPRIQDGRDAEDAG
jgi:hypothetical protein